VDRDRLTAATIVTAFVVLAGIAASQRYTVWDPWKLYVTTVQQYMAAGVRGDTLSLVRRSVGSQPMTWVLDAAGRRPAMLKGWAAELEAATGKRHGDTVVVLLWADNIQGCSHLSSVSASLLNHTAAPRVLSISSPCLDRHPLPALPW
jgi:hypothetical protein